MIRDSIHLLARPGRPLARGQQCDVTELFGALLAQWPDLREHFSRLQITTITCTVCGIEKHAIDEDVNDPHDAGGEVVASLLIE